MTTLITFSGEIYTYTISNPGVYQVTNQFLDITTTPYQIFINASNVTIYGYNTTEINPLIRGMDTNQGGTTLNFNSDYLNYPGFFVTSSGLTEVLLCNFGFTTNNNSLSFDNGCSPLFAKENCAAIYNFSAKGLVVGLPSQIISGVLGPYGNTGLISNCLCEGVFEKIPILSGDMSFCNIHKCTILTENIETNNSIITPRLGRGHTISEINIKHNDNANGIPLVNTNEGTINIIDVQIKFLTSTAEKNLVICQENKGIIENLTYDIKYYRLPYPMFWIQNNHGTVDNVVVTINEIYQENGRNLNFESYLIETNNNTIKNVELKIVGLENNFLKNFFTFNICLVKTNDFNGSIEKSYVVVENNFTITTVKINEVYFICKNNRGIIRKTSFYSEKYIVSNCPVAGFCESNLGFIENCYSVLNVVSELPCSGFIGIYNQGVIANCYFMGVLPASPLSGGFCVSNQSVSDKTIGNLGNITHCYSVFVNDNSSAYPISSTNYDTETCTYSNEWNSQTANGVLLGYPTSYSDPIGINWLGSANENDFNKTRYTINLTD